MNFEIRKMTKKDKDEVISMMGAFYSSDAVFTNGSVEIFNTDFENCINASPFLEGYIFEGCPLENSASKACERGQSFEGCIAEGHYSCRKNYPSAFDSATCDVSDLHGATSAAPAAPDLQGVPRAILGYAMIAKSFSTEFGKPCIWLEDLYLKPEYRGNKIIPQFLSYVKKLFPDAILRLELERENTHALHVYKKSGFIELPYVEMMEK